MAMLVTFTMTVTLANMPQMHLGHIQNAGGVGAIRERLKTHRGKVKLIIRRQFTVTKDLVKVEGHLALKGRGSAEVTFV